MENKKVLFITFDMSGYYDGMRDELKKRYREVDYYNTAKLRYKYKNPGEKIWSAIYKLLTGKKLKNFYKLEALTNDVSQKQYDLALIVRPDLFFDSQLEKIRSKTKRMIAYYHDSVNNIPRKQDVVHFFDKVWSYEKQDQVEFNLEFIPNFIYFEPVRITDPAETVAFSVMSNDYRVKVLEEVAKQMKSLGQSYRFFVMDDKPRTHPLITFITKRLNNDEVVEEIKKCNVIVDVHKFGIQDGLTFRTFEALGFRKKLITTNTDVVNYDFYNPTNIFVIGNVDDFQIPVDFFSKPYEDVPEEIVSKYTVQAWLDKALM